MVFSEKFVAGNGETKSNTRKTTILQEHKDTITKKN